MNRAGQELRIMISSPGGPEIVGPSSPRRLSALQRTRRDILDGFIPFLHKLVKRFEGEGCEVDSRKRCCYIMRVFLEVGLVSRWRDVLYDNIPQYNKKTEKKKRPRLMAVVNESCTGCEACIPFCPVDCIDHEPPPHYTGAVIPPVRIRWHECIGCQICARVCEGMAWNAIDMISIDQFEEQFGIKVGDQPYPPEEALQEAVSAETAR